MPDWTILEGDCVEQMRGMAEASVDAVVCDPPYALGFMSKQWDQFRASGSEWSTGHATGKDWKGTERERPARLTMRSYHYTCRMCGRQQHQHDDAACPEPDYERVMHEPTQLRAFQAWSEQWAREALRVLKPGGHLLAFGGTRTYHRLACAIEDAGFEIRDTIAWMYGSGFPKSLDVSKAIDKLNGKPLDRLREFGAFVRASREAAGLTAAEVNRTMGMPQGCGWWEGKGAGGKWDLHPPSLATWARLKALYGMDDEWDWFIEWAEAEREKVGESDAGAAGAGLYELGIDGLREFDLTAPATPEAERWQGWGTALKPSHEPIVVARKPLSGTVASNVLEFGTGALNVDGCRIEGDVPSVPQPALNSPTGNVYGYKTGEGRNGEVSSAPGGRWPANVVMDQEAAEALDEQTEGRLSVTGVYRKQEVGGDHRDGSVYGALDRARMTDAKLNNAYANDSGGASRFFYVAKASSAERNAGLDGFEELPKRHAYGDGLNSATKLDPTMHTPEGVAARPGARNVHPTVKPIELMRWLVRLVTPPGGTCLDPFAGSGTTGCAAMLEGFRFVGIEREPEYAAIARARIEWWSRHPDGVEIVKALEAERDRAKVRDSGQMGLFGDGEAAV